MFLFNKELPSFLELDVSESITAKEVLELPEVKKLYRARNKFT